MKGPSLNAIRKFKEQQERKKREQEEQKAHEKLTTLVHRAAQGDKKAKSQLKQIEKVQEERNNARSGHHRQQDAKQSGRNDTAHFSQNEPKKPAPGPRKPKVAETDFEELMRLAKNNTNEVIRPEPIPKAHQSKKPTAKIKDERSNPRVRSHAETREIPTSKSQRGPPKPVVPAKQTAQARPQARPQADPRSRPTSRPQATPMPQQRMVIKTESMSRPMMHLQSHQISHSGVRAQPPMRRGYQYRDEDEDDYDDEEDEYESDGFVVNEEDDEAQNELRSTLKSLFRYDKRRCDLREQELDRQYRQIGNVSTFEDLEREERRASRLAACEDARALREEEERKRLKKIRLKNSRD